MTHIVKNHDKCEIRVDLSGYIVERVKTQLTWKKGILTNESGKELALFHYIVYKGSVFFNVPEFKPVEKFYFEKNGYFLPNVESRTFSWGKSIVKNFCAKARVRAKMMLSKKTV